MADATTGHDDLTHLYNLVLEPGEHQFVVADGVPAVALAHGIGEGRASHAYWGRDVVADLDASGWDAGYVNLPLLLRAPPTATD